eukprot:1435558-Rhodomonas_salina.2
MQQGICLQCRRRGESRTCMRSVHYRASPGRVALYAMPVPDIALHFRGHITNLKLGGRVR